MAQKPREADAEGRPDPHPAPLVPLYGGAEIVRGIQAFRRGDMILYTVRGEPETVRDLMGQLDKQGIAEVVALVSHRAETPPDEAEPAPSDVSEEDADAAAPG